MSHGTLFVVLFRVEEYIMAAMVVVCWVTCLYFASDPSWSAGYNSTPTQCTNRLKLLTREIDT